MKPEANDQSSITDGMIVAGSDAIEEFWVDLTSPIGKGLELVPKLVEKIYTAMEAARQLSVAVSLEHDASER